MGFFTIHFFDVTKSCIPISTKCPYLCFANLNKKMYYQLSNEKCETEESRKKKIRILKLNPLVENVNRYRTE